MVSHEIASVGQCVGFSETIFYSNFFRISFLQVTSCDLRPWPTL